MDEQKERQQKTILFALTLAVSSLFANGPHLPRFWKGLPPSPKSYLYGVTRVPGSVKLKLRIDEQEKLRHVDGLKGRPELVASAVRMVYDYKFAAAQYNGKNVASDLEVLNFQFPLQ